MRPRVAGLEKALCRVALFCTLGLGGGGGACTPALDVPAEAIISCEGNSECPEGLVCRAGVCRNAEQLAVDPPDLVGQPQVTPAVGRVGTTFSIAVTASKALVEPPTVILALEQPVALSCQALSDVDFRCDYVASGAENGGQGGPVTFDVVLQDMDRNRVRKPLAGVVVLDFIAPSIANATVGYTPASTNPLSIVAKATVGTTIIVGVTASELIDTTLTPTLVLTGGSPLAELVADLVPGSLTSSGVLFALTVGPDATDGAYTPRVTMSDIAGNIATDATFVSPTVEIKTSPPTVSLNQDAVTYVRSPWGRSSPETRAGLEIPAGPYFALAPADTTSGAALAADAIAMTNGRIQRGRVWTDATFDGFGYGSLLGVLAPLRDSGGEVLGWPQQRLARSEALTVYVTGIDEAGNESAPVKVQRCEWVATPNVPSASTNPHLLVTAKSRAATGDDEATLIADSVVASAPDDSRVSVVGSPKWRKNAPLTDRPPPIYEHAMAYDAIRDRVVLFGGALADGSSGLSDTTWEFDGNSWQARALPRGTPRPERRRQHAMTYDAARGRTLLFGGTGDFGNVLDALWEWDGTRWFGPMRQGVAGVDRPKAYARAMLTYDSQRGRAVLFVVDDFVLPPRYELWEWDGEQWSAPNRPPSTPRPELRAGEAVTYDASRGRVVMHGGFGATGPVSTDLWEWNGSAWSGPFAPGVSGVGNPGPRANHAMAYDPASALVISYGGYASSTDSKDDLWTWNGTLWSRPTVAGVAGADRPLAAQSLALAHVLSTGAVIAFGGQLGGAQAGTANNDTWLWSGSRWSGPLRPANDGVSRPGTRTLAASAYDSARGRLVVCRGYDGNAGPYDVWEWDGSAWHGPFALPPGARRGASLTFDSTRNVSVFFGGSDVGGTLFDDVWEWDGATWSGPFTPASRPEARSGHATAFDPVSGKVIVFGGTVSGGVQKDDVWEWNGTTWSGPFSPGSAGVDRPTARVGAAMAYDATVQQVVMFAGQVGATQTSDLWFWDPATRQWTFVGAPGVDPWPTIQLVASDNAMAYDPDRGVVALWSRSSVWDWESTTRTWHGPFKPGANGVERPEERAPASFVYDSARRRYVLFGGVGTDFDLRDVWELPVTTNRDPAVQFTARVAGSGVTTANISGVRVRAYCGGSSPGAPGAGASLEAWSTRVRPAPNAAPAQWVPLALNAAPSGADPATSLIDWSAASATEAIGFFTDRDQELRIRCVPAAPSGLLIDANATVGLDHVEVRIGYQP